MHGYKFSLENHSASTKMDRKESNKKWQQTNAERLRIYQRNYRAMHREEGRKYMQKYRAQKKAMIVGKGDIIEQAMEASQTFNPLDKFVFHHSESMPKQSNAIDTIDFGLPRECVSSTHTTISQTSAQELVSNRSRPLPVSSTGLTPEMFDWSEDIDNSSNRSVLISELKSCPGMESNISDMKAELTLLEDNNFF